MSLPPRLLLVSDVIVKFRLMKLAKGNGLWEELYPTKFSYFDAVYSFLMIE